jgi:hypothetical protein
MQNSTGLRCVITTLLVFSFILCHRIHAEEIQFNRDVRPILSENCFACHGPDSTHRKANLRLDLRPEAVAAKAIVPGDADASQLISRIRANDPDLVMPPPDSHRTLSDQQKETLQQWITEGAVYQNHWSYEAPVKPITADQDHPIDALIRTRLQFVGLKPAPKADRRTLIRRLAFDLTGLPPTPADVRTFEQDTSPQAYESLVDRLLQSPHYGERMACGWLDVVRFADTIGYHSDTPRNVWPYRDWVIDSFNNNKPFDRFTLEQIAGDLLPDASQETRIGSAFNRLLLTTEEGGAQPKDYEARMLSDRVRAIGSAWLGQTTGCAQCHDHKFDPFTTRDFYSLGAFFADIQEKTVGPQEDGMLVLTTDQEHLLAAADAKLSEARAMGEKTAIDTAEKERTQLLASFPRCLVSVSMQEPRIVRILPRGNWMDETGEIVTAAFPEYLTQRSPVSTGIQEQTTLLNRLDFAKWLVSRENPLTARTVMNRLWKQFFGTALSRIPEDLGSQGELPPNGPLLDWLACEFMDSGWDMKHMVRTIVTSETYQQSSIPTLEQQTADPQNREHARQSRFRLDAEMIRDNALAVSGLLVRKTGGPSIRPYQPAGYWENLNFPTRDYVPSTGEDQYRRGLYIWWQRSFLHPSLLAFDTPSREECVAERSRSNIPQQALTLMNDPCFVEAFRILATRAMQQATSTDQRITWMWQEALQRDPTAKELDSMQQLFHQQKSFYEADRASAEKLIHIGLSPVAEGLDSAELAAWTHVARVLLNLHESIVRN